MDRACLGSFEHHRAPDIAFRKGKSSAPLGELLPDKRRAWEGTALQRSLVSELIREVSGIDHVTVGRLDMFNGRKINPTPSNASSACRRLPQWIRSFYEAARVEARGKGMEMPVFDAFWKSDDALAFPITDEGYIQHKDFRDDPLLSPLGTASGRIEIYSNNIAKMHYDDCPPHPTWMEPVERLGGPDTKFPLHIDSKHLKYRLHSQLCGTALRATYAIAGREPCLINPQDASARGTSDGDIVRVFNDRGQILAGAHVTDAIRPGVICVNEGGWFDPENPRKPGSLDRYGDVNNLAIGIGTSKLAQGNCGHTAVGDVEKYKGKPLELDVFRAPVANA